MSDARHGQTIAVQFGRDGLIPVVVQDHLTGEIRMFAFATIEAVRATLETGRATFWSRSRNELWEKGPTSGNSLDVRRVLVDCDADCLVYSAEPLGATCHTGAPSCFFQTLEPSGRVHQHGATPQTLLARLEAQLEARKGEHGGEELHEEALRRRARGIGAKLREEADELARAVAAESDERVVSEAADVVYHLLVALRSRDVSWRDVLRVLESRSGVSGHEEKLSRLEKAAAGRIGRGTIP